MENESLLATQPGERLTLEAIKVLEEDLSSLGMTSANPKSKNIYVSSPGVVPQAKKGVRWFSCVWHTILKLYLYR